MNTEGLTAKRLNEFRIEARDIDAEIEVLATPGFAPRHLQEAAEATKGLCRDLDNALSQIARSLRREERPLEDKVRELEDIADRLTHPEFVDVRE